MSALVTYSSSSESSDSGDENVTPCAKKPRKEESSKSVKTFKLTETCIDCTDHVIRFLYRKMYCQCFLMKKQSVMTRITWDVLEHLHMLLATGQLICTYHVSAIRTY